MFAGNNLGRLCFCAKCFIPGVRRKRGDNTSYIILYSNSIRYLSSFQPLEIGFLDSKASLAIVPVIDFITQATIFVFMISFKTKYLTLNRVLFPRIKIEFVAQVCAILIITTKQKLIVHNFSFCNLTSH